MNRAQQAEPPAHRTASAAAIGGAAASDCYQLLLGARPTLPPPLAPALIGRPSGGPLDGQTVYEALFDPRLTTLLLERLRMPGRLGPLRFVREPSSAIPSELPPLVVTAEQSNSSVIYGDTFILQLFRRVSPGTNPDLELPLALAHTGCTRVPAPAAWFEAEPPAEGAMPPPEPVTLGVLQPFLTGSRDGWQLALDALAADGDFTEAAHALGGRPPRPSGDGPGPAHLRLRRPQIDHLAAAMSERLDSAAGAVPALQPYRAELHGAYEDLAALRRAGRTWAAQRIHGDLHLGQALLTGDGGGGGGGRWSLIDFEGEPSRPLAERRRPQPPVRDIAGMLRSFDYAAAVGRHERPQEWAGRTRAAYCAGYAEASGTDPRDEPELLRAHETDKAVYEVLYEARHRPDWLSVPMTAIRRLATTRA
ncbi:Maltokinase OS=Streptomyces antimycoticus OX=68175 GN=SSPO_035800 PE=3 SV=1 [Streptomyces antimycoticus]